MKNIYPVLLAGGKGTRLWPLSYERESKSFARIGKMRPLITETIDRLSGLAGKKNIFFVVDEAQKNTLTRFTGSIPARNILVEPFGRSTACAVGLAAIGLHPEAIMAVFPTDALIRENGKFRRVIKKAARFVTSESDALLCVGISPKGASTAYGYIKLGPREKGGVYAVSKFTEKPTMRRAGEFIKSGNYLWNAGMFVFKAKSILGAIKKHAPLLYSGLQEIKKEKRNKRAVYSRMKNVSIDYQIMEKSANLHCVKGDFTWDDLGSWKSMEKLFKKDKSGNARFGKATLLDTKNCIVYNSTGEKLGVVGVSNAIIARTKGGTLVAGKDDAEKVKELVERLKKG